MRVVRNQHAVNVELKELFLICADCGRHCGRDDRCFQITRRLYGLCVAPNKELVVNVRRGEGVQRKTGIAPKIATLR